MLHLRSVKCCTESILCPKYVNSKYSQSQVISFKSKVIGDFKRMENMSKKLFPEYDELYHFFQPLWSVNPNPNQQKYHISVIF